MMQEMRTTLTLEPDAVVIVRRRMAERGLTFKQAVNDLIREGSQGTDESERFSTRTARMGNPSVNLDKALALGGELEDEELIRKYRAHK